MKDTWTKFNDMMEELLEENNLNEVLAAMAGHMDDKALTTDEGSQAFADYSLASEVLNAASAGTDLNYGWKLINTARKQREIALRNFKAQSKAIIKTNS